MKKGLIVKALSGFYYVESEDGSVYTCRARGVFKKDDVTPLVGDIVKIDPTGGDEAVVTEIEKRENAFVRPSVANVDQIAIVTSVSSPKPNTAIIDKFMLMTEKAGADILLCINKIDLGEAETAQKLIDIYGSIYPVIRLSGMTGEGIGELRSRLAAKRTVFAGASGVGKSTLLNILLPDVSAQTGSVSSKTKRGKNTTRHVELFRSADGGMIFDTPGFTSIDVDSVEEEELHYLFPEMEKYIGQCKYENCRHVNEPGCAVKAAVKMGEITESRYSSYLEEFREISEKKKY